MKKVLLVLISVFLFTISFAANISIAVYGFESMNFDEKAINGYTKIVESEIFDTELFKLVDRQSLQKLIDEQKLNVSGIVDDNNKIIQIGKLAGADYILIGSLEVTSGYTVSIKILDVKTAEIKFLETQICSSASEINLKIKQIIKMIDLKDGVIVKNKNGQAKEDIIYKQPVINDTLSKKIDMVLEIGIPTLGYIYPTVNYNSDGKITSMTGFNFLFGLSYKNYLKPVEPNSWNTYWSFGTIGFIIPYIGGGIEYFDSNGYFYDFSLLYLLPSVHFGFAF